MSFLLVLVLFPPQILALFNRKKISPRPWKISPLVRGETQSFEQHFGREKNLQEWRGCRPLGSYSLFGISVSDWEQVLWHCPIGKPRLIGPLTCLLMRSCICLFAFDIIITIRTSITTKIFALAKSTSLKRHTQAQYFRNSDGHYTIGVMSTGIS